MTPIDGILLGIIGVLITSNIHSTNQRNIAIKIAEGLSELLSLHERKFNKENHRQFWFGYIVGVKHRILAKILHDKSRKEE